jgi:cytochrome c556
MSTSRRRFERAVLAVALLGATVVQGLAHGASIFEFDQWMDRIEKRALSLQKSLDRGDSDTAVNDAREIDALYRRMEEYFAAEGNAVTAVELSKKGWQDASEIASRIARGDEAGARSLIKVLMEDCRTCHRDYKPLT